jgi:acetyl-CoA carboxylase carboxyl transferase subunit beta
MKFEVIMAWFKRKAPGLMVQKKKDMPDGLWVKCDGCGEIIYRKQLIENAHVCNHCDFHFRIQSKEYIELLCDANSFKEMDADLEPVDFLNFKDSKRYEERLKAAQKHTGLKDAIRTGTARIKNIPVVLGIMDFGFIGGSMGSVVGEKVARAIDHARIKKLPLIIVCASGGARMMESIISLMQMAKTSAKLAQFSDA